MLDLNKLSKLRFGMSEVPKVGGQPGIYQEKWSQWFLERSFFRDFVYRNPRGPKKGQELADAVVLFDDVVLMVQVKAQCGRHDPMSWATEKLLEAFKQLSRTHENLVDVERITDAFRKLNPYDPSLVPEILKIEDINHRNSNPDEPFRQLYGYAISAKRYALYSRQGNNIQLEKASGHGLGYLFAPKERKKEEEDEETPAWVMEAWEFLLRRALELPAKDPAWLDLPAMMRMVVTTPNVFKQRRPEWLGPFNFFLFPMLSEKFGGYPAGFDKSNFVFITPYESDRKKWSSLKGVNLMNGQSYEISMQPALYQDKVVPESFRILLRTYPEKLEVKSLAPDGTPCIATTHGLLQRARISAGRLVPVGKETDRRWEQGEDPSMIDSDVYIYEKRTRLVVADRSERERWSAIGLRRLIRETKLSQTPISNALKGKPVRPRTLSIIRQTAARLSG